MFELIKLNKICTKITDGSHYSPMASADGKYPMLSVKDMQNNCFSYKDCKFIGEKDYLDLVKLDCKPKYNDVLIAKDGSYLKHVFVIKEEIEQAVLSSIGILRPNTDKVVPEYLKYYLHSNSVKKEVAKKYVSGSALPRIILKNFAEIEIINRPLQDQQKIASVLSSLDAKIELNNRINAELEAMAKTLYDYWFVQFDFPDENGSPYKSSGGAMEYNAELKREIPKGWEVKKLGKVLKTALGGTPSTDEQAYWKNATIPWLSSGEIASFPIIQSDQFITQKGIENSAAVLLPKGSVVISIVRYIRPSILSIDACTNQSVVGIYESEKLKNTYIYPAISKEVPKLMAMRTGAQQPHINKGAIDNIQIFVPSDEVLTKYYKFVDPLYNQITNIALQNQQLAELRDWLLPMLMNGQVKVMDNTVNTNGKYR